MSSILNEIYKKDDEDLEPIPYTGLLFMTDDFKDYLHNRVKKQFFDTQWTQQLVGEGQEIEETGFSPDNLFKIFESQAVPDTWRIGETLAECVLEDYKNHKFYYASSRDQKNPNSSQTGADLVGICDMEDNKYFVFGEVKTSSDQRIPPNVFYGDKGMSQQLENLKLKARKRHALVRWFWSKAINAGGEFKKNCKKALVSYTDSNKKVKLIGVLVRDTSPNKKDLCARAKALNHDIPAEMKIELLAIYTGLKAENDNWVNLITDRGD